MRSVLDAALHTGEDMGAEMPAKIRVNPPDLAAEIRSASNWRYDLGAKKPGYERLGLPELWLVDTSRRTVLVYRRSGPDGGVRPGRGARRIRRADFTAACRLRRPRGPAAVPVGIR